MEKETLEESELVALLAESELTPGTPEPAQHDPARKGIAELHAG
jgi:hypothetical protein